MRSGRRRRVFTERAGHATELARDADTEAVVVFSGDGGFNEALNGARPETVLGFVPGGGTSVLPRALGLPRDPVAAARQLVVGRTRRIGLGRANGRRFGFAAGVGLDAELIRRMDARGRRADGKRPGDAVFAWTAVKTLAETRVRFDPALEVEGHGRAAFALVANADPYTYLGRLPLRLPRGARLEGGLDLLGPRSSAHALAPRGSALPRSRAGRACRSSSCTTRTGSRSGATRRCRSSSTARTSATSRRSSSRPSATPSRSSSDLRIDTCCGRVNLDLSDLDMSRVRASTADMRPLALAVLVPAGDRLRRRGEARRPLAGRARRPPART